MTFMSDSEYRKRVKENTNLVRNDIHSIITASLGPEYILGLPKYMNESVEFVVKELETLGWNVEAYDKWSAFKDDYCVMDLTIVGKKSV